MLGFVPYANHRPAGRKEGGGGEKGVDSTCAGGFVCIPVTYLVARQGKRGGGRKKKGKGGGRGWFELKGVQRPTRGGGGRNGDGRRPGALHGKGKGKGKLARQAGGVELHFGRRIVLALPQERKREKREKRGGGQHRSRLRRKGGEKGG